MSSKLNFRAIPKYFKGPVLANVPAPHASFCLKIVPKGRDPLGRQEVESLKKKTVPIHLPNCSLPINLLLLNPFMSVKSDVFFFSG